MSAEITDALHRVLKAAQLHTARHPQARVAADAFVAVVAQRLPCSLAFVAGGVFVDFVLQPFAFESYERAMVVGRGFATGDVDEISFRAGLTSEEVLVLATAWASAMQGGTNAFDDLGQLPGVAHRRLVGSSREDGGEAVDRDIAVVAEAALAVEAVEGLVDGTGENAWTTQTAVVRRLERTVIDRPDPAMVAFEQSRPTVARRTVSAAVVAGALLRHVEAGRSSVRALVHATLLCGIAGLAEREGLELKDAAARALPLAMALPLPRVGLEPHRVRVAAVLHDIACGARSLAGVGALALAYEVERMRCPQDVDFDLTNADLWAAVALRAGAMFPLPWVRVLVDCFGAIPAGAWVSLPDGRRGLVLGEAPPSATLVLVDGVPTSIASGLRLLSATEVRW